jgi:hypothetical protein
MAKWAFKGATWTPVAVADSAAMTMSSVAAFMAIQGVNTTQRWDVVEIYMGGQGTSSSPMNMIFSRDSVVGTSTMTSTMAGFSNAPLDPATGTAVTTQCYTSTNSNAPQRSPSGGLLNLSFNGFGGIVRWVAPPGSELKCLGSTQPFGDVSLSAYTGGTPSPIGAHIIYETY